jgi:endonuclease/exonuclease/phosphatase family metal-dependent hydrolase
MRLAVWNCNMRLHDKLEGIRRLAADVIVVPECACPEVLLRRVPDLAPASMLWTGRSPQKGLAILSFRGWHLTADAAHDPRGETTIAARVRGPVELRLVAAWARAAAAEPVPRALDRLRGFLAVGPAAVAGDFNDTLTGRGNVARRLHELGFSSAYHGVRLRRIGSEDEPTLYLRRREGVRGHRDAVFLDARLVTALREVTIGSREAWAGASDHAPIVADLETDRLVT